MVLLMQNYYSKIDDIILTFSNIEKDKNGFDAISFRFERKNASAYDFAEGKLPENQIYESYGFSDRELVEMQEYIRNNSFLIWEIAHERAEK